jgi:glucosyl-dolichyl phosphate glucuronosyltransferase
MNIAVILCTYNRCDSLAAALESVAASRMPASDSWEVLVVDNNSRDKTREVAHEYISRYPGRFRYLFEPRQGKSNALNSAVQNSNASILAFMDDDVKVAADWLHHLTRVLLNPCFSGSGGRIIPESSFKVPAWLNESSPYSLAPLAMFDLGPDPCELKEPPFGTNMAFRREVFSRYGDFRRDLGPRPGSEIRSEDTEFGMRLLRAGERLWYEPAAVVHHAVPHERVKQAYFLKWWYGKGRADVREGCFLNEEHLSVFGIPLVLFRRITIWSARWLLTFNPPQRFDCKAKVWWLAGEIRESFAGNHMQRERDVSQPQGTP